MKSKKDTTLVLQFFLILFLTGMMETIIVGIMPSISVEFGISDSITGQLISVYALIFALIGPILIYVLRKYRTRKTLLVFLLIFVSSNVGMFFSNTIFFLFLSRIISALSASVLVAKTLESCFSIFQGNKGKLAFINMGFSSSIALGVPLGTYFSSLMSWQYIFGISAILSLLVFVILYFIYPRNSTMDIKITKKTKEKIITRSNIKLLLVTMLILAANMFFVGYISPFLIKMYSFNITTISWLLAVLGAGGVLGSYISAWIMRKFAVKKALIILLSLFTLILLLLGLHISLSLLVILLFLWNMAQWATGPIIQVAIVENATYDTREQLISLNMSALNIGSGLGGILGGVYILHFSISSLPIISAIIALVAIAITLRMK
jgi:DHA1 family purine base/nucleoside efflux pump-like MFS transporter